MNCTKAKEKIDQLVFENDAQLLQEVEHRIAACESCSDYFKDSFPAARLFAALKNTEPKLDKPVDLTNAILSDIDNLEQEGPLVNSKAKSDSPQLAAIFIRMLAAASVCLLLVLGVEQYKVVTKVRKLETAVNLTNGSTSGSSNYVNPTSAIILSDASELNPGLVHLILKRTNKSMLQTALNYQSEQLAKNSKTFEQSTFLNSKLYRLMGN